MARDYDAVSADDARQEFEYDGREMDAEAEKDMEGSRIVPWTKVTVGDWRNTRDGIESRTK